MVKIDITQKIKGHDLVAWMPPEIYWANSVRENQLETWRLFHLLVWRANGLTSRFDRGIVRRR